MEKLRCIVIDDDPMALRLLEEHIKNTDFLTLVNLYDNSIEAANQLSGKEVDLIFLDIEMPGMSGLELIDVLDGKPQIIIVSSKKDYVQEAFDYEVTDYLVKPVVNYQRFLKAAGRARKKLQNLDEVGYSNKSIFIKEGTLLLNIFLNEIQWLEAYGDFVKIHTTKKMYTVLSTLKSMEDKLPASEFVRIHRSFIVRIDKIENIDQTNLQVANRIIPISNSYRKPLMQRIKTL
ncbi:LytTR family DNA-binding domain-containing protein [Fulvivirgaceae bacterium BMA12]|uniref:LytTR family DNA-binding domain-containing protein n=1 Tax=Agaribacillus aureus TaxID=3051825 RepID=A0ABT8LHL3_9BACT|nr:LytTR family DNA-binding domain-containing protein [Fulvivirgaceae bacterium BMA12]